MIPFLHIGPLTIPTFGLMVATAMLSSYFLLRADFARRGLSRNDPTLAETFIAFPCLAGIVGAKLYHVLETPADLFADPFGQIFSQFGFAWFGGMIAGVTAFILIARSRKIPLLDILDAGSAAAALGYGIGRIGCLLSGDGDYGTPTSLPWGMSFPNGLVPTMQRVHPTPLYELIASCAIAYGLWLLGRRQILHYGVPHFETSESGIGMSSHPAANHAMTNILPRGSVFAAYLVLTGAARFLMEFIRINPRGFLGLSNAQQVSALSIVAGVALWFRIRRRS